ncbi:uncharacterized protein [Panulirus ornatus]|uniref:uncharacterized protein n=1 Tax=Panulirus ornatus TaxID=150431 RepID=UPI003A8A34C9
MMSTQNSSIYRRHVDVPSQPPRVRPVVVGAPYVLCLFTVAVILMGVGTFITSHSYEKDPPDHVLLIVGSALLGLAGLLLLGSVLVCLIACCRNRQVREAFSDDLLNIGGSTFYGGRGFVHLEDETELNESQQRHNTAMDGVTNPAYPSHNEALMILANTVAEERHRQRTGSRKYIRNVSHDASRQLEPQGHGQYYLGPLGLPLDRRSREDLALLDHLGLDRLRRVDPHPELAKDFDLGETEESNDGKRDRSYSMAVRRPMAHLAPVQNRLRRNVTFSPAIRARIQRQQQQKLLQQQQEMRQHFQLREEQHPGLQPQRKRSSRRRKRRGSREETPEDVRIHQLPEYNPDILNALGIQSRPPHLQRSMSRPVEGVTEFPNQMQQETWREDPDITHGSLRSPRRRPSVAMGVRGIRSHHSGSAYRHHSSIYASDMDLHRVPGSGGLSGENDNPGQEPHRTSSSHSRQQNQSCTGSDSDDRRLAPSPVIHLPYPHDQGSLSSLVLHDHRRDNSTLPRSSSASPSQGRALSNISSESCCSGCCDSGRDARMGHPDAPSDHSDDGQEEGVTKTKN